MRKHEIILVLVISTCLLAKISNGQTNEISLINFSMSTCDCDTDPEKLTTHIDGKQFRGDTLVIEIATTANCCAKFIPKVFIQNNMLFLDAELAPGEYCFCDCCFGLVYQINGIVNKDIPVNFRGKPVYLDLKKHDTYAKSFESINGDTIFTVTVVQPSFPGGPTALSRFISKELRYPEDARMGKVEGKVFVQFVVRKTGEIDKDGVKVIKGVCSSVDAEAIRIVKLFPTWEPGQHHGEPVNSQFVLPIRFALTK
jgi:TonB family protein